jgi:hypothetical protein
MPQDNTDLGYRFFVGIEIAVKAFVDNPRQCVSSHRPESLAVKIFFKILISCRSGRKNHDYVSRHDGRVKDVTT